MREDGHAVEVLVCDEELRLADLDGTTRNLPDSVDLLYLMTHGTFGSQYVATLEATDWIPALKGLGGNRLAVVVFDTCWLIDSKEDWQTSWANGLGLSVNLLLGFEGPAPIDRASALRGKAFADELVNGKTYADAWIRAVNSTTVSRHSKAVAVGVGDSAADAQNVLDTASLAVVPPARMNLTPSLKEKY